ncbi:MAG: glycosyltransferase family 2 protein [Candidatus Shapirobacteria bacterium]|jgi:glycosyltransferase involved in cell wall biosynthesis
MKRQATISVTLATYNEEKKIGKFLDSVFSWANEIILVDGHSQDKTLSIAKKYKNIKIIETDNKPIFHINKQLGIDACKSDWILQLDADEIVTPALLQEINQLLSKKPSDISENGFWINRSNYFLGTFLKKGGQYPDSTLRLYKKGMGRLPCKDVHEQAEVKNPVGHLTNDLQHFADISFSRYLLRANRYTTLLAQELSQQKLNINFVNFLTYYLIKPLWWFLMAFFRHRGYVDGFPGFVFAYFSALRFPIAYTKYWELQKTNRSINMSDDWDTK